MVNRAQIRVDEGKRPLSELKDMEAQAAQDEYTLVNAQGQYTIELTKLSQLLNQGSTLPTSTRRAKPLLSTTTMWSTTGLPSSQPRHR